MTTGLVPAAVRTHTVQVQVYSGRKGVPQIRLRKQAADRCVKALNDSLQRISKESKPKVLP